MTARTPTNFMGIVAATYGVFAVFLGLMARHASSPLEFTIVFSPSICLLMAAVLMPGDRAGRLWSMAISVTAAASFPFFFPPKGDLNGSLDGVFSPAIVFCGWTIGLTSLSWSIAFRRGLAMPVGDRLTAWWWGAGIGLLLLAFVWFEFRTLTASNILPFEMPPPLNFQSPAVRRIHLSKLIMLAPFFLIVVGLWTARAGRNQAFLISGGIVFAALAVLIIMGTPHLEGLSRASETFLPIYVVYAGFLLAWTLAPVWLMLWAIDWIEPDSSRISTSSVI